MHLNKLTISKWIIIKLFLIQILIIIGFWYGNTYKYLFVSIPSFLTSLGRLAGLLLVLFTLLQLIMRGRISILENLFGFERLNYLHKKNGYLVFVLLLLHPVLLILGYAMSGKKHLIAQYFEFIFNYDYIWLASIANLIFILVVITSIYAVKKRLKYEIWFLIHLFTYLAVILAWFHQLSVGTDFLINNWFKYYWYLLYISVFLALLYYRFTRIILIFNKHKFYVEKVEKETADTVSIYIKGNNLNEFKFQPGQFLFARFLNKELGKESHPFSFSNIHNGNYLRITVKNEGDFTSRLPYIKPGTKLLIDGPHGAFTAQYKTKNKIFYIAGGVGITPIRALLENAEQPDEQILFYANKTTDDIIFANELDNLSLKNNFKIYNIISRDDNYKGIKGRVSLELIKKYIKNPNEYDYFICGPVNMAKSIIQELLNYGIPKYQIHFEEFTL